MVSKLSSLSTKKVDFLLLYMVMGFVFLSFRGMPWGTGSSTVLAFMMFFAVVFGTLWSKRKEVSLGSKAIVVPLLLILVSSFLWVLLDDDTAIGVFYFFTLLFMFLIYLTSINKGHGLVWFAVPIICILSVSVTWDGIERLLQGEQFIARATGFSDNTDQVASILAVCIFLLRGNWKWLAFPAMTTILLTGSYWALLALVLCSIVAIAKREVRLSRRFLVVLLVFLVATASIVASYESLRTRVWQEQEVIAAIKDLDLRSAGPLDRRLDVNEEVLGNFSFVGHGLDLERDEEGRLLGQDNRYGINVHNVPLILLDDLGVLASAAWLFVTGYAVYVSKRYRYAFIAIFAMSVTGSGDWWWFNLWMPFYFALLGLVALELRERRAIQA